MASLMGVCLVVFPVSVLGQGRTWAGTSLAQMVESARWRIGALRVNASLSLTNVGYDSDLYYGHLDEPAPDFTLTASIPVQLLVPLGKKAVLEISDSPQYMFYFSTEKERAWDNSFGSRIHFALKRFYIQAGGELSSVRRRMSPELNVNVRERSEALDGTLLWQASRNVSFATLYDHVRYSYGDPEIGGISPVQALNREEGYVDLVTYFQPSTRLRLFVDGQYGLYTFSEGVATRRNTRSYGLFGGLDFVPREGETRPVEPVQGSISLGYKRFDVLDAASLDGSGFVGAADVSVGLFKRTAARVFLSRDFEFSVYSDGTYYLSTTYGGGVRRRLSRRATFTYDVSFSQSAYPQDEAAGPPDDRNFRYTNHLFNLSIQLTRSLAITFQTMLSRRTLGEMGDESRRNFFGLSLVYGVPSGSISAPARGLSR